MGNKECNNISDNDNSYSDNENTNKKKNNLSIEKPKNNNSLDFIHKDDNYIIKKSFNEKKKISKLKSCKLNKILQKNKENIIYNGLKFSEDYNIKNNISINFFFNFLKFNEENITFDYEKDNFYSYSSLKNETLFQLYNDYNNKVREVNIKIYSDYLLNDTIQTRKKRTHSNDENNKIKNKKTIKKKKAQNISFEKINNNHKNINKEFNNSLYFQNSNYNDFFSNKNSVKNSLKKIGKKTNSFEKKKLRNSKISTSEEKKEKSFHLKSHCQNKLIYNSITNEKMINNINNNYHKEHEIFKSNNIYDDNRVETPQFYSQLGKFTKK